MTTAPVDELAQALRGTEQLVAAVRDEQWTRPTPCTDWKVRDLVNHLVGGNRLFAGILCGGQPPPLTDLPRLQGIDHLGDDPVAAYREAADALLAAFRQPGVLEQVFSVPVGPVPGIVALRLRIVEALVHGWDLARATGQPAEFPDDLAERELTFTRGKLADLPPNRRPFAPPQSVADDAPAIDRLAACLGRRVTPDAAPGDA